ncbi:hypothetical protein AAFC00_002750 [Neodothiora populina]|uniref:Uncharacterized protein n=1 Tax=Neodothiora populina TaxID=2781224 RepID=A0ABR3P841_9PEZI
MDTPMDETMLGSFDLTPAEIETLNALQSFDASHFEQSRQQQQHHHHQHHQQQQHQLPDAHSPSYFDVDPILLSNAASPLATNTSPGPHDTSHEEDNACEYNPGSAADNSNSSSVYPDPSTISSPFGNRNPFEQKYRPTEDYEGNHHPHYGIAPALRHQLMGHRRSVSQPPEEPPQPLQEQHQGPVMVFTRQGILLGESTNSKHSTPQPATPRSRNLLRSVQKKRKLEPAAAVDVPRGLLPHHGYGPRYDGFGELSSSRQGGDARGWARGYADKASYDLRRSRTHTYGIAPTSAPYSSSPAAAVGAERLVYPPEMVAETNESAHNHPQQQEARTLAYGDDIASMPSLPAAESASARPEDREKAWFDRMDVQALLQSLEQQGNGGANGMTTAHIMTLARLGRLDSDISDVKDGIRKMLLLAYSASDGDGSSEEEELERARQEIRARNNAIKDISIRIAPLPPDITSDDTAPSGNTLPDPTTWPDTAQDFRTLDQETTEKLLEAYNIPYTQTMFLHEKKVLLLRFLGVNRGLMREVLD